MTSGPTTTDPLLRIAYDPTHQTSLDELLRDDDPTSPYVTREWIVTNGLGGYASGTVAYVATRRYHGLLIAAAPAPLGRTAMLAHLSEIARLPDGRSARLGLPLSHQSAASEPSPAPLVEFRLENGLPVWRYDVFGVSVERRMWMPHRQNTICVSYRTDSKAEGMRLEVQPWIRFRPHDGPLDAPAAGPYSLLVADDRYAVSADGYPELRMRMVGEASAFTIDKQQLRQVRYHVERLRGYDSTGELYSPGFFRIALAPGAATAFLASTDDWDVIESSSPDEALSAERERRRRLLVHANPVAREGFAAQLVFAADQFLITPAGRIEDTARARAVGDEIRTVIAGYHWFTDWGRDTMISLEGLTLATGRLAEAGYILRTFAAYVEDGLIPNLFPERGKKGLYHTADATLWFFHALERYIAVTGDRDTLRLILPKLVDIVEKHLVGTRFAIHVDRADGLLSQGQEGYALTWMDAKVGDLVVTPRRGKAVEINALWYNALRALSVWLSEERGPDAAKPYVDLAAKVRTAFNARFWNAKGRYLYDVIDGPSGIDDAFRPNQILAVSLTHAVLEKDRWRPVIDQVREKLLTPVGLRSLEPGHPDYKSKYFGDLRARDLAYHQGTVWAWLIGPFIDAWLKAGGDRATARDLLKGFEAHLGEAGVGTISEIFDAEAPFTPRGCIAQAWSVAEVLRCLVKTAG